ncbi:MAG TPA: DMT family transporter [Methanomassiliicoccales archaeon]|nr:DMT family transporter [Methanomassiliicoccales archaeon]
MSKDRSEMPPSIPYVGIAVAIVGVSFASIFIRWSESPPLVIAAYRMLLVSIILLPFAAITSRYEIRTMSQRDMGILILIGAILAAHFYAYITAVKMTTVASAILLATCHPVIVGIISILILKDTKRAVGIGILAGMSGLGIITLGDLGGGNIDGDIIALISGVFFSAYLLLGRVLRQRVSIITYVFVVFSSCALVLLAAAFITGQVMWPMPASELLIFLGLAVISTIMGHLLFNFSLRYLSASVISVSYLGEPVGAILLAAMLLDEIPSVYVLVGGMMILVGILLTARTERNQNGSGSGQGH